MNTGRQQQDYREKHKKYFETQQYQKSLEQIQKLDAGVSELLAVSDINIKEITPLIDQIEEEIETISHLSIVNDDIAITINAYQEKIARYKNVIENVNTKNRNALLFQLMAVNHDVNETLSEQQFFGNFNNVNYMVAEMERLADKLLNLEQELQAFEEINLQQLIACKALIQEIPNSSSLGSYNCYQSLAKQAKQQFMLFADEMKRIFPDYAEKYENYRLGTSQLIINSVKNINNDFIKSHYSCVANSDSLNFSCDLTVDDGSTLELPPEIWDKVFDVVRSTKDKKTINSFGLTCTLFQDIQRSKQKNIFNNVERDYTTTPTVKLLCTLDRVTVTKFAVLPNGNIAVLTNGLKGFLNGFVLPFISPNFIIDGETGKHIRYFGGAGDYFDGIVAMPNSDLVTVRMRESNDCELHIWDSVTGKVKNRCVLTIPYINNIYEITELRVVNDTTVHLLVRDNIRSQCAIDIDLNGGHFTKNHIESFSDDNLQYKLSCTIEINNDLSCQLEYRTLHFYSQNKLINNSSLPGLNIGRIAGIHDYNLRLRNDGNMIISYTKSNWDILDNYHPQTFIYVCEFPKRLEEKLDQASSQPRRTT